MPRRKRKRKKRITKKKHSKSKSQDKTPQPIEDINRERFEDIKQFLNEDDKLSRGEVKFLADFLLEYENDENNEYMSFLKESQSSSNEILKRNTNKILKYYQDKLHARGKEIWRSQANGALRNNFGCLIFLLFSLGIFIGILNFVLRLNPSYWTLQEALESGLYSSGIYIIFALIISPFYILPCITYIIIYQRGIKIRHPWHPFVPKFIPYKEISKVRIPSSRITAAAIGIRNIKRLLDIRFKNGKSYRASSLWIDDFTKAQDLIQERLKS